MISVCIYDVTREWTSSAWLCEAHVADRRAQRWVVRGRRLPPPRQIEIVEPGASGTPTDAGAFCPAAFDDRETLRCQDCHLAELTACPTCGGPVVYPGAIGLVECHDPAHVEVAHVPAPVVLPGAKVPRKRSSNAGGTRA